MVKMIPNDIIRDILKREGLTQQKASEILGMYSQGAFSTMLRRQLPLKTYIRLLDKLGYEIVVRKKTNEYVIDIPSDGDAVKRIAGKEEL